FYLCHYSFLLCLLHPLSSTLFPYTTLFRSAQSSSVGQDIRARGAPLVSCQKNGWSRSVLIHQIESGLYQRQVLADKVSNFERRLPSPQSELAVQTMKDPYIFDFIPFQEDMEERDIEQALVRYVTKLLL